MMRRLNRDHDGAVAIEYALIALLIGVGIVGSLVTTKGSINAIFGTASSRMASSGAAGSSAPTSTSPRAGYWDQKSLAAQPTVSNASGGQQMVFTYSDGTQVALFQDNTVSPPRTQMAVITPDHMQMQSVFFQDGKQIGIFNATFWSPVSFDTTTVQSNTWTFPNTGNPMLKPQGGNIQSDLFSDYWSLAAVGVPQAMTNDQYDANGMWVGKTNPPPTQEYTDLNVRAVQDYKYFKDVVPAYQSTVPSQPSSPWQFG